jgi:hypothetical protein
MGIFDIFKKEKPTNNVVPQAEPQKMPFDISCSQTPEGFLQIDYYNMQADFKDFYDITRLIVKQPSAEVSKSGVYEGNVSWYGMNDAEMLDPATGKEIGRRADYSNVLAELDINALQTNPDYCSWVMQVLLNKKRVEKYLEKGLEEQAEEPCGNYVGGIARRESGYYKYFDPEVGREAHNSSTMVDKRNKNKESKRIAAQNKLAANQAKIAEMEAENQALNNELR